MIEGCGRERNVVIEFDSYQMAVDCYFSAKYQAAKSIRVSASKGNVNGRRRLCWPLAE